MKKIAAALLAAMSLLLCYAGFTYTTAEDDAVYRYRVYYAGRVYSETLYPTGDRLPHIIEVAKDAEEIPAGWRLVGQIKNAVLPTEDVRFEFYATAGELIGAQVYANTEEPDNLYIAQRINGEDRVLHMEVLESSDVYKPLVYFEGALYAGREYASGMPEDEALKRADIVAGAGRVNQSPSRELYTNWEGFVGAQVYRDPENANTVYLVLPDIETVLRCDRIK